MWLNNKTLMSNLNDDRLGIASLTAQIEACPVSEWKTDKIDKIPFTIESGPPGCSSNYSITSLLTPKSSFLANYPQELKLRHLHNKLIKLSTFTLHRSSHRKNMNFIE